ncbi:hydroxyethylthiazole kinase [Blautia massiliensis]|uniref:hydroxyethylthiazole kinase n=1 Tax=Blautia TaxID=572511 RepID=UPI0015708216|nr:MULTISPECIES: hydroxyethylthiazole kinase [Blautia]MCC2727078.1 hydroxyethylthiazole kinase [Blautia sp. MSK22_86]NSF55531.1 hydroxyethylthiazole kinase [Blautia massiliensis (ex Durand et al. 2017)]NSK71222.1 hydroxyethylthiazole kinase [Blautia massiliensis (ex Durand et al. 2017)]
MRQRILQLRKRIKEEKPLIHCITNPISIHDCANVVLAVGARPIMAEHPAEVTDITALAGALMLNLGNITDARIESMKRSMRTAMKNKIPVLLDLVGVACSDLRLDLARELLSIGHPAVLKGNMSELLAVSGLPSHAIGIDAGAQDALTAENMETVSEVLRAFSRSNQAIVLATGKQDFVTDGERVVLVQNGSAALSGITGTGCMVGALTAAFLPGCEDNIAKEMTDSIEAGVRSGVEMELNGKSGNYLAAAVLGTALMGIAGEEAEKISRGPGSFQVNLLDEIYGLSDRQLLNLLKIEMY